MINNEASKGQVVLYGKDLKVHLEKETVWLTQKQMAVLFSRNMRTVNEHIQNIFKEQELSKKAVIRKFRITASDGKSYEANFYNLDVIISVGYRVKSKNGTRFRIWATKVLKKHLVDGYTINEKRLKTAEHKYLELQRSIKLLGNVIQLDSLSDETKGLIKVIAEYGRALDILDGYDHQKVSSPKGTRQVRFAFTYEHAQNIIQAMKQQLKEFPLFGREKDKSFQSSINAIHQTFGGKDLYPTVEEKATHLLYFVIKNHSFVDGNKRIAAALFICFLQKNGILLRKDGSKRIDDNALVALTLMVAASKPEEKELLIKVILNLLI
ncbi:MAG TPA: RhuM family protein [Candidatus Omnitrophota bacterium]|nr:RhuM family protein [Candidatus Omnitrophota bacterium]HQL41786.1 RhuM family protein [Candidatus Omnitrophota bacterium]